MAKRTAVEATKHKDRRTNIPTSELRGFVEEDERSPKKLRYPRDTSKDPQLVWKGKDEQDETDLLVDAPPIYIQEKIHPQAIIENLRAEAKKGEEWNQLNLFADFNGINFEDLVDFYHHDQKWANRMILGDSLQVMASLAEKEGLKGQVQMIYFDPPYGIKFDSNWQVSTRERSVRGGRSTDLTRQPEQIKAFRDTWKLGIHSYLSYIRDRLIVSRELLTQSGSLFLQIGEENLHLARSLLDEVFGSANFIAQIYFRKKTMPLGANFLERMGDYVLWYAKNQESARGKYKQLYLKQNVSGDFHWNWYELPDGSRRQITQAQIEAGEKIPADARVFRLVSMWPPSYSEKDVFPVYFRGQEWWPAKGQCWPTAPEGMQRLIDANRVEPEGRYLRYVLYLDDDDLVKLTTSWTDTIGARDQTYVVQTSPKVIERCILMTTDPGDLVLDPTCGGGTTAFVAEQWGRRWITIDTSRVALALARTRLMTAKFPYYFLIDSIEGSEREARVTGKGLPRPLPSMQADIRRGFVYRRVPRVNLKIVANTPGITDIRIGFQEQGKPILAALNGLLDQSWEDWEVPRDAGEKWPQEARHLLAKWWELKRQCQEEIDASIARNSETELLYDQPYEDSSRIRVAGPFTVESLSPHRVLVPNAEKTGTEEAAVQKEDNSRVVSLILDNLKKAGVQNTVKGERLQFERLEPCAGTWIHATGEYREGDKLKRVAVCVGPEHGTVGPELVREAAMEATQGPGHDLLLVLGLAFDPHVNGEANDWKKFGRLLVLPTRVNPDLTMGDELLKKTSSANLFMVFGEPDLSVHKLKDGKVQVEIKGVDIYDPTTGVIRSASTDEIACWFIDTDYNGQSFFVRHAYFTGADDPYEKLRRALRAEIDEAAWESLYSTVSRPFDPPTSGKIAVKVINHYGDEVLKVYDVSNLSGAEAGKAS